MFTGIQIGYYFLDKESKDFSIVCISDKNIDNDELLKDKFAKMLSNFYMFIKSEFRDIFLISTNVVGWNANTNQYIVEYNLRCINTDFKNILYEFNNEFYNEQTISKFKMELKMKSPYEFWSITSLQDELKRRGISNYTDYSDKEKAINFLNGLDRKKGKNSNTQSEKQITKNNEQKQIKGKNMGTKDQFSKMNVKDLVAFKNENGLDCRLLKSMSIEELQDSVRQAYSKKTKTEKTSKKIEKKDAVNSNKKSSIKEIKSEKKSEKSLAKKTGKKKVNRELLDEYVEKRKADRKKREAARRKSMTPELKEELKAFRNKFKDKKINWNNKLKKEGLWINGMNFLSSYEKYKILIAKGKDQKKLLAAAEEKVKVVGETLKGIFKKKNNMLS